MKPNVGPLKDKYYQTFSETDQEKRQKMQITNIKNERQTITASLLKQKRVLWT